MVSLSEVQSSNARISTALPPDLVGVFVGATSGIGEATLKQFAKHIPKPRAYFVGRSQEAGDRILGECKAINPAGEYIFVKADVSLIRVVDEVCKDIKAKEKAINILCLSAGLPIMDRSETSEHIHVLASLNYYSRIRFITNLLPLLQHATALRRVIFVAAGGREGPLDLTDFPAIRVPLLAVRTHLSTLITLGLEAVARSAPDVAFVHSGPGTVRTKLLTRMQGLPGMLNWAYITLLGRWVCVPIEECGERHMYLATSARYPAATGDAPAVSLGSGVEVVQGTTSEARSGVYSVVWDGERASPAVLELLAEYREKGVVDEVWRHTEGEFNRITKL